MRSWREYFTRNFRSPFVFWGSLIGLCLVLILHLIPTDWWVLALSKLLAGVFLFLVLITSLAYLFPAYWILPTKERLKNELTYWLAAKEEQTGKRVDPAYAKHLIEQFAHFYPARDEREHTIYSGACYASLVKLLERGFYGSSPFERPVDDSLFSLFKEMAQPFKFYNAPDLAALFGSQVPIREIERSTGTIQQAFQFTPFEQHAERFLPTKVSFPLYDRLEHQLVVAPTGHGKTQLLERQILFDIEQGNSLVVIDSKPDMVKRLSQLDIADRLIVIDPRDAPALNPFRVSGSEEDINRVVSELLYFFKALLGNEISGTMGVIVRPLIHLMCVVPNSDLEMMVEAIQDPSKFSSHFHKLPEFTRKYLEQDYKRISRKETVDAVTRRIYEIGLQSPTFLKMFNAPENKLDLVGAMETGKVVLVSTETNFLHDLSPVFGKYIIAQVVSAALRRRERKPCYLYIDEAGPYADEEKTEQIFSTLRSYGVGAIMAFQHFGQLSTRLQHSVAQNTAIKFLAGEGVGEIDPKFVAGQPRGSFAALVRHHPPVVSLPVKFGALDTAPKMDDYKGFRRRNKAALTSKEKKVIRETPPEGKAW